VHELSIAQAILEIATRNAGGRHVTAVCVRVGRLRQVVPSALEFAFELSAHGTPAEGAVLELEQVPAAVGCRACGEQAELKAFPLACPACGALEVDVIRGEELVVQSLELDAELSRTGG
jgi:hydrogenase nickel incorporation protein HypA/HybF